MLRGVKVAAELGMTSLVVTYRNDGEGPRSGSGKTTLGQDEAEDVERALEYAIQHGASRIVLFGWSMGATIALTLATDSVNAALIKGIVAISPVLDWKQTLQANCKRAGLPAFGGTISAALLGRFPWSRFLGLPHPLALRDTNWLERAHELRQPILLIHGKQDRSTPSQLSEQLSFRRPDLVSFVMFDSDHTLEWNSNPEIWERAVSTWMTELAST
jgi:dipeptidyl aminopeptidase/acylaminoacyl peptidase